jgi:hypothetical protein
MKSQDAQDRFYSDLVTRLWSIRNREALLPDSREPWWPFPDSIHSSDLELRLRRSVSDGSEAANNKNTTTTALSSRLRRTHVRSLSAQDIWHDRNKDSEGNASGGPKQETPRLPPRKAPAVPEQYVQYLQQKTQQTQQRRKPQLRKSRARSNLKLAEIVKIPKEVLKEVSKGGTLYKAFDDEAFGRRQPYPAMLRKSSLLSQELRPEDILIEEEEVRKQMDTFTFPSRVPNVIGEKLEASVVESWRRDSGYDSSLGDDEPEKAIDNMYCEAEADCMISDYDFACSDCTW